MRAPDVRPYDPDHELLLDEAIRDLIDVPEVWIARPSVLRVGTPEFRRWPGLLASLRSRRVASRASASVWWLTEDGALLTWRTQNQRRAFGHLPSMLGGQVINEGRAVLERGLDALLPGRWGVEDLAIELSGRIRAHCGPTNTHDVLNLLLEARTELLAVGAIIEEHDANRVVVADQHGRPSRAVAHAAMQRRLPSIYIPHTSAVNNRAYQDLPFGTAALRGPAEVEFYRGLGASPRGLHAVGALHMPPIEGEPRSGPPIVAPSAWNMQQISRLLAFADEAIDGPYLVAPHPRTDVRDLRPTLSSRAVLRTEPTAHLLERGASAIIQNNSGVAVEAMRFGIPVVEVPVVAQTPSYAALATDTVKTCETPKHLTEHLQHLEQQWRRHSEAAQRHGRAWISETGQAAHDNLLGVVQDVALGLEPLLDGWRRRHQP